MSSLQENDKPEVPELQQNLEILERVSFFADFPPQVLKLLAYLCDRGDYAAGDLIFEIGDDPGQAIYILSGTVTIYRQGLEGMEKLRSYTKGDFLGGLSLLGPLPSLFTIKADTRIRVLTLSREQFSTVLAQFPNLDLILKRVILRQLRGWESSNVDELDTCCLRKVGVTLL